MFFSTLGVGLPLRKVSILGKKLKNLPSCKEESSNGIFADKEPNLIADWMSKSQPHVYSSPFSELANVIQIKYIPVIAAEFAHPAAILLMFVSLKYSTIWGCGLIIIN